MVFKAVTLRVMPESPSTDLEALKESCKNFIEIEKGRVSKFEEEPLAFGLKAVIIFLGWPEEKDTDKLEDDLGKIKGIASAQVTDIRRAFG